MSVAAIGEVGAIAPATTGTDAAASGGWNPMVAAAERIQQLQALISQVETGTPSEVATGSPSASFGAALNAAQSTDVEAGADAASPIATVSDETPVAAYGPTSTATGSGTSTATGSGAPVAGAAYVPMIQQAAARNGLDPALLYGLIEQESGFDPGAHSGAGAEGLTQLMPGTAASLGVAEPLNPAEAIEGGAHFLAEQMRQFGGNAADALAAYNAGPGAVQQYGGVPPYAETQQYVSKVLGNAAAYNQTVAGDVRA
ncbi:MAG TPA: transglycosylase SLT domain-containing protein [Solirubrobacteraceae bacterium]|jgi:soluble lytic murein transglycosylase-like protein|nr:transglycosylase SLT domain-containing protein [Solirubrobacteraceae bacterium]